MTKKQHSLTEEEYISALEKMKNSPKDRVGVLGELGSAGLGGVAGVGLSSAAASVAGAATFLGSSTLGSIVGGVLVTTTPVGWVASGIAIGGAIGYGISKLTKSGATSDAIKKMNIQELQETIASLQQQSCTSEMNEEKIYHVIEGMQLLVKNNKISQDESTLLLAGIENGEMTVDFVFDTIFGMLDET